MSFDAAAIKRHLREFNLALLFNELGWDRSGSDLTIALGGQAYHLQAVAQKRGLQVFHHVAPPGIAVPDYGLRRQLERQVAKSAYEHLLIFSDAGRTRQLWQWVRREAGRPLRCRQEHYLAGQSGERLVQKLQYLAVSLEDEEQQTIVTVRGSLLRAFDVERVTRRFYERFREEHRVFLAFIAGLQEETERSWYASLMLNRLMFVYFIQKKRFLNGDPDYLATRLREVQLRRGKDRFLTFYRHFLVRLFHEGLAQKPTSRSKDLDQLLGKVPYLDGGLFDVHQLERDHTGIQIPDEAFTRLFAFFDAYQWHLDERPLRADNEINPDVLGYIFEKYINQKQMGAYYTKEDITGYIARNTLLPFLLNAVSQAAPAAFAPGGPVWSLLQQDPDRYIFPAMLRGVDLPLPAEIAAGVRDVQQRGLWNRAAGDAFALPTETWREHVGRRQRCLEIRARLRSLAPLAPGGRGVGGEGVLSVNDLITLNLDSLQLCQDIIENCADPDLLRAFYGALGSVSVLDPACGSGAFLFAALNRLEPLYDACLERMQAFVHEADPADAAALADFRAVLEQVEQHPNRRYFILKSIVVNNLYGVDIMDEAVEICKLRLFLKLVAQVEQGSALEPLPDIDFNIRAGNTLVGFATLDEARTALEGEFDYSTEVERIIADAQQAEEEFKTFRSLQTQFGLHALDFKSVKKNLRRRLELLRDQLDRYLAAVYGMDDADEAKYRAWHDSHKPFHWFAEFYGIMSQGGFDVIIGNPPFVEYSKVRKDYFIHNYHTEGCGNLYAFVLERCLALQGRGGRLGMLTPLSLLCTKRTASIRELYFKRPTWTTAFDMRPSALFEGVAQRLCLTLNVNEVADRHELLLGGYRRWTAAERDTLLQLVQYTPLPRCGGSDAIPRVASELEARLLAKLPSTTLAALVDEEAHPIHVHRICRYYIKAFDFVPRFEDANGQQGKSEDYKPFHFCTEQRASILGLLNSTLMYWLWRLCGDGFHCGYHDVYRIPYSSVRIEELAVKLTKLSRELMGSYQAHSLTRSIETRKGAIRYQEFYPAQSKPLIDEIDRVLAQHYGFTDEELDFIVNYDIKHRLGQEDTSDE